MQNFNHSIFIFFIIVSTSNATFANSQNSAKTLKHPTIALALGGGGIKGAAHIGVLKVLEQNGIKINYIAGCSMGSIIGGLYCAGVPLDKIEDILIQKQIQKNYAPGFVTPRIIISPITHIKLPGHRRKYAGIYDSKKFEEFLNSIIPESKRQLESLDIPFCAVATNLVDGQAYKIAAGSLARSIVASSALPPVVQPVEINDCLYVDGAIRSNVPTVSAKQFNPDILIAVCVDDSLKPVSRNEFKSVKNIATRIRDIMILVNDERHLQNADITISPKVDKIPVLSKNGSDVELAIKAGENETQKMLPDILQLINKYKNKK